MKISQREARRLRKKLGEMERAEEARRRSWASDYPGGVNFTVSQPNETVIAAIKTARMLGHAVVVTLNGSTVLYHAMPVGK